MLRFIRRRFGRIIVGVILVGSVYGAMTVVGPWQRERRISDRVISLGGQVSIEDSEPMWIPQSIKDSVPFRERIISINLNGKTVPSDLLSEIGTLQCLKRLFLSDTHLTDSGIEELKTLSSLEFLDMANNQVTDAGLRHLKGLTKLFHLNIDQNMQISDAGLEHLKNLNGLVRLYLNHTNVSDGGLEHLQGLTELRQLDLEDTQVSDIGLEKLDVLTNLSQLRLHETQTTPKGRAMLLKSLPGCTISEPVEDEPMPK